MPQAQLHAIIHGKVQGVSFRYYTIQQAQQLALNGWVRNLPDGTVECLAVGPREALETLLAWLGRGPSGAHVTKVDADWSDVIDITLTTFQVRYDSD